MGSSHVAWEDWESTAHEGRLICCSDAGGAAALEWTYGTVPVHAIAVRRDGDAEALLAWWRKIGRQMSRDR